MSVLALTKEYSDLTLMFASDVHNMWSELETKVNGAIASDNVTTGWANWGQITLAKDIDYTIGSTASSYLYYASAANELVFANVTTAKDFLFKVGGTTVGTLDTSDNLSLTKDVYFYNKSTVYPLSYLIGYQKPVLVYFDETSVNVEQNTTTANRSLIVFPSGPIAVTEDTTATHKFRQLKLSATANGYSSGHAGAADSGLKSGLSLSDNTWYFVYAVVVQGGTDAANPNFILVVDSVNPSPSNWGTLDAAYTAGMWVYLGCLRYGFGLTSASTLVPFVQDHSGWISFTGRGSVDDFFGIKVADGTITSTTYTTLETFTPANSGEAAPATCSHLRVSVRPIASGADMNGTMLISDASDNVLWDLQSFAINLADADAHGMTCVIPNITSIKLKAKTGV